MAGRWARSGACHPRPNDDEKRNERGAPNLSMMHLSGGGWRMRKMWRLRGAGVEGSKVEQLTVLIPDL